MKETNHQDELSLPDDLIEVATQLSDDAEHLSTSYPSGKPNLWAAMVVPPERLSNKVPTTVWRRGLAAAAAILVIAPTTWYASGLTRSSQSRPTRNMNQGNPIAATTSRSPNANPPNRPTLNMPMSLVGIPVVDQQDRPVKGRSYQRVYLVPVDTWEHIQAERVWQEQQRAELARCFDRLQKENAQLRADVEQE